MKRVDLVRQIARAARAEGIEFELLRVQGGHDVYQLGGLRLVIPRHREIAEGTADGIRQQAGQQLGKGWWR